MSAGPTLTGERVRLRPLTRADIGARYLSWLRDPEVTRYLEVGHRPPDEASLLGYLERFASTADEIYAIEELSTGEHVGNVTLNHVDTVHGTADTGLLLGARDRWGRGYASEAWSLIIAHAFEDLGLRKIVATVCRPNAASSRVLRRLGSRLEGTLRGECLVDGVHVDRLRYGLFREEFRPFSASGPADGALSAGRERRDPGAVVWLTGLSGSGKSTLAGALAVELATRGLAAYVLDGDVVRSGLNADLGFSPADRAENVRRVANVAALMADAGIVTIAALISPYRAGRSEAREIAAAMAVPFLEVFLSADLATCEARDPKGLYRRARSGELPDLTGIGAPYEPPVAPEVTLETATVPLAECVQRLRDRVLAAIGAS